MSTQRTAKNSFVPYLMLLITLFLVAGVIIYLSYIPEQPSGTSNNFITLNGPWKFTVGDNMEYAQPNYDDSGWENMDLSAPPGAHDDDVGLSGFIPGWTAHGHANYSGWAWYRLKVPLDSLTGNNLVLAAPPAVDDVYQLFINGSLSGSAGNFYDTVPVVYSIQPRLFQLPENVKNQKTITIAFRVWMSPASLSQDAGGIHIAPALGEKTPSEKKYRFQWSQTIKGYIVEVALPVMFILLAITIVVLNSNREPTRSCKWFVTALILLGLLRLNQATYFWFQFESTHQATIVGQVILRPLVLGSWVMAWREWFDRSPGGMRGQPKWLPKIVSILVLLYMTAQLLAFSWISNSTIDTRFQTIVGFIRLLLLVLMLLTIYQGFRKQGRIDLLVLLATLLMTIGLFPGEVSTLHIIPGIWFPYGVGVSRGQFFYAAFVFVMYVILIRKSSKPRMIVDG